MIRNSLSRAAKQYIGEWWLGFIIKDLWKIVIKQPSISNICCKVIIPEGK